MPIAKFKDTKPRFARLGKIRKGAPKGSNRPGEDLTHFRFDSERADIVAAFVAAYGEEPASLPVYLPHRCADENFSTWQELWTAGAMQHRCDGEMMHEYRDGEGKLIRDDTPHVPCPYASGEEHRTARTPGCKPIGRLEVVLPGLLQRGFVGTVTFETHSLNDIGNILGALKATAEARGADPQGLRGIEFNLYREPEEISMWDETKGKHVRREKWLCKIAPAASWVQMQMALASAQAMGGEVSHTLALPEPEAGADEQTAAVVEVVAEEGGSKRGAKATEKRTASRTADPGPPPPTVAGRQLTVAQKAFGKDVKTAGIAGNTLSALTEVGSKLKGLLGTDSTLSELEALCPDAWVMHEGARRYSRLALTDQEGKALLARLRTVVDGLKRGPEPGFPFDNQIPDFEDDSRE